LHPLLLLLLLLRRRHALLMMLLLAHPGISAAAGSAPQRAPSLWYAAQLPGCMGGQLHDMCKEKSACSTAQHNMHQS
jgi:hypothetical protein